MKSSCQIHLLLLASIGLAVAAVSIEAVGAGSHETDHGRDENTTQYYLPYSKQQNATVERYIEQGLAKSAYELHSFPNIGPQFWMLRLTDEERVSLLQSFPAARNHTPYHADHLLT